MGLQPHQFNWTRKSQWRTQFNYARVQHQTQYKYTGRTGFNCQTQELEVTLQSQRCFCFKKGLSKPF